MDAGDNAASRKTKFQRLQAQVGIFQDDMSGEIADRQATAMLNTPSFETHVSVHHVPFIGFKTVIRQDLVHRLNALLTFALFRLFCPFRPFT